MTYKESKLKFCGEEARKGGRKDRLQKCGSDYRNVGRNINCKSERGTKRKGREGNPKKPDHRTACRPLLRNAWSLIQRQWGATEVFLAVSDGIPFAF